jgi:hypothetical protein
MATFNKFDNFGYHLGLGVHNFSAHSLVVALTNIAPTAANSELDDITQISYTNLSSRAVTISSWAESGGTSSLVLADLTLTASGTVAGFRYIVLYNDTPTSPADPMIGWIDRGSTLNMVNGDTLLIDWAATAIAIS